MMRNTLATVEEIPPQINDKQEAEKIISFPASDSVRLLRKRFTEELSGCHRDLLVYTRSILFDKDQARDLVQEASLTAWSKFESYDESQADFSAWMRGILRNKIRDWVKSKKGAARPEVSMEDEHLDFLETHFSPTEQKPRFSRLKNCLRKLPKNMQEAIQLTYYLGYSGEETSEKLAIQHSTLRKRLSRARLSLHECLRKANNQQL